jgi:hypothetical protein
MVIFYDDQSETSVELAAGEYHRTFLVGKAFAGGLAVDAFKCPETFEWQTGPSHTVGLHLTVLTTL